MSATSALATMNREIATNAQIDFMVTFFLCFAGENLSFNQNLFDDVLACFPKLFDFVTECGLN